MANPSTTSTRATPISFISPNQQASAAIYIPFLLNYIYDNLVLGLYNTFVWRCPTRKVLSPFFNQHISTNICDIGVGTGYHLAKAPLPRGTEVILVDLNDNCLKTARQRIQSSHPSVEIRTVQADVRVYASTASSPTNLFTTISAMYLFHCLPGPPAHKAQILASLSQHLDPAGTLIGSTILGKGVRHNFLGRCIMAWHNRWGIFDNHHDDAQTYIEALEGAFEDVEWKIHGAVLLFEARKPRS